MSEDSWEQRMSERAGVRRAAAGRSADEVAAREYAAWTANLDRLAMAIRANMTLGEGIALLNAEPWACACVGPPHCCRFAFAQAGHLHRGAHIVAKLLLKAAAPPHTQET